MRREGKIYTIIKIVALCCSSLFFIAGCATGEPPRAMLATTESKIEQAIDVNARDYAPAELRESQKQLDQAKRAIEDEEYEEAERLLQEAQVAAEYAAVKSRSAQRQESADVIRQDIETLRDELESS